MIDTVFDIVLTGLLALAVRSIWQMSKDLAGLRAEFTLHRTHVEANIQDHENRLRYIERSLHDS